jgi:hypothetical protein
MELIGKFLAVPIEQIMEPKHPNVTAYPESFWLTINNKVLFYFGNYPQCNRDRNVCEILKDRVCKGYETEIKELPITYFDRGHFISIFRKKIRTQQASHD